MSKAVSIEKHKQMISRHKDEFKKNRQRLSEDLFIDRYEKELAGLFRRCAAGEFSVEEFDNRSSEIEKKRSERLVAMGEKADAMTYKPMCGICDDSGYINGKVCKCLEQIIINDTYAESGLSDMLRKENFGTFDTDIFSDEIPDGQNTSPRQNIRKLRETMENFVKNFNKTDASLFFVGPTATGKTFLAHCIAKELLDKGHTVIYTTSYNMCDRLVDNQFGRLGDDEVSKYFDCDFLIIDELGQEANNEPSRLQLYNVINERMNKSKKTLITSNYSLKRLETLYEERLISRLSLYRRFIFFGNDLRMGRKVTDKELNRIIRNKNKH